MRLFKFISSRYINSFLNGNIRFQPLSYYQNYEQQIAIGDPNEAMRLFRPSKGLEINNLTTGKKSTIDGTFVSQIKANEIFVFCLSQVCSKELAHEFNADICVEITDGETFLKQLEMVVTLQMNSTKLIHQSVTYYEDADPPGVNWALPDMIVMSKRIYYRKQAEYRIAFAKQELFDMGKTVHQISKGEIKPIQNINIPDPKIISIDNIQHISLVHEFKI